MRYYFLFVLLASIASAFGLVDDKDYHWEPYHQETNYDVRGLNDLVARMSISH